MDADFVHELFAEFGRVDVRRMFSGQGVYAHGVIFAIIHDEQIYLKTSETTRVAFERERSKPLTFTKKSGQRMVTSYWRLPERLYDAPDELADWARDALGVSRAKVKGEARKKAKARPKAGRAASAKKKARKKSRL